MVDPGCGGDRRTGANNRADSRPHRDSGCFIAEVKTVPITDENCGNETEFAMVSNPASCFIGQIRTPF